MTRYFSYKNKGSTGISLVETMIVVAIAGIILAILFIAIPELQVNTRDSHRRAYARTVYEALQEFNKSNGKFPGCNDGCDTVNMQRFMKNYLPDGNDPSTGQPFRPTSVNSTRDSFYGSSFSVESSDGVSNTVYIDNGVYHYIKPKFGQVIIATAHWCFNSSNKDPGANGSDKGPPLAGSRQNPITHLWDQDFTKFAILIYQEHGEYYCLDDFANDGSPLNN
jgi:type II secretory pathway pseudopilin PulG